MKGAPIPCHDAATTMGIFDAFKRGPALSIPLAQPGDRLILYSSDYCPFCSYVARSMRRMAIAEGEVEVRSVDEAPEVRMDIARATGRRTVPVLRIVRGGGPESERDEWLFESRDIADFLRARFPASAP